MSTTTAAPARETTESTAPSKKARRQMPVDVVKNRLKWNPFTTMPPDHTTIAGQRFYKLRHVAEHFNVSIYSVRDLCITGKIGFVVHPGLRNGERLIPESELRRVLTESF
jgi:hypothetical protein